MNNILFILIFILTLNLNSAFGYDFITSVQSHAEKFNAYVELTNQRQKNKIEILNAVTKRFSNSNTGVWIHSQVYEKDIEIFIPDFINSDDIMEILIKAHTLRSLGARKIALHCTSKIEKLNISDMDNGILEILENLLKTAGVTHIKEGDKRSRKTRTTKTQRPLAPKQITVSNVEGKRLKFSKDFAALAKLDHHSLDKTPLDSHVLLMSDSSVPSNLSFLNTLVTIATLNSQQQKTTLITPYLPYARSDKKDHPGVSVTGRLIADLIESVGTNSILFVRPHAAQSEGFFKIPVFAADSKKTIGQELRDRNVSTVISPDAGFQKDATSIAEEAGLPVAVVNKVRNYETSEILLVDISGPSVKGLDVVIVDDETASGSTADEVAGFLKRRGAQKIYVIVTHLAGSAARAIHSDDIEAIIVTDSLEVTIDDSKLKVLSIAAEMVETLRPLLGDTSQCHIKMSQKNRGEK